MVERVSCFHGRALAMVVATLSAAPTVGCSIPKRHQSLPHDDCRIGARRHAVTHINRAADTTLKQMAPAVNVVHSFAAAVEQRVSLAWTTLHTGAAEALQNGPCLGEVPRPVLPSWIRSELQARLQPSLLPARFPGQEFVVRPIRRALAWRRAASLMRSHTVADLSGTWPQRGSNSSPRQRQCRPPAARGALALAHGGHAL